MSVVGDTTCSLTLWSAGELRVVRSARWQSLILGVSAIGPPLSLAWYVEPMSGTIFPVTMGDRGRLVVPSELRKRLHLEAGAALVMIETERGLVLATREQLKGLVRLQLQGLDLVDELLEDRRRQAAADDVA